MKVAPSAEALKAARAVAKGNFTRKYNLLSRALKEDKPTELIKKLWEEVNKYYQEVQGKSDAYDELLITNGGEADNLYMDDVEVRREEILVEYQKWKGKEKSSNTNVKPSVTKFKVDPPKFKGSIREYLSWAKHFKRLMVPQCGEDPFVLLSCLEGSALDNVKGLDDYELIMKNNQIYCLNSQVC